MFVPALITISPKKIKIDDKVVILKLVSFSCFEIGEVVVVTKVVERGGVRKFRVSKTEGCFTVSRWFYGRELKGVEC